MNPASSTASPPLQAADASWLTPRRAFIFLGSYFLLQTLFRVLVSDSAELDESHQLLCVQEWRWGYGSDPPLYTWLQRLTFNLLGLGIPGLALLKNALLFGAFLFTYLAAKQISKNKRVSVLAMLSLLLFPQIAWESQRDLTHSVLATTLAAATFYVAARLSKSESPSQYLLLGICAGLGTLSKYTYCIFALALAAAAWTIPPYRRVLLNRWMLLTLGVFGAITVLHFLWILQTPELFWTRPEELIRRSDRRVFMGRVLGIVSIGISAAMLGGAITAIYVILFRRRQGTEASPGVLEARRWIVRTLIGAAVIGLIAVLAAGVQVKERWFQPVLVLIAILAALLVRDRLTPSAERNFALVIGVVASLVLVILPVGPLVIDETGHAGRLNAPFSALSGQLRAAAGRPLVIAASTRLIGGNLKLFFPESTVVSPEFQTRCPTNTPWLLVWDAAKSPGPPPALLHVVRRLRGADAANFRIAYVEALLKYADTKTMKLGYARLP